MIYTGIDLVEVARITQAIERYGPRFLTRVYTEAEIERCHGRNASFAARWAAKEATAKLFGVGLRGIGAAPGAVGLTEIEVLNDTHGRPVITLHGSAAARAEALGIRALDVSLAHTRDYAVASVVAFSQL